ncbi:hypothetical protein HD554DRAFT_2203705 [Boletus coccyginus]|nr:hypothetical protein HD554DRAFT_2203705 [Boletus coccyginus]
MFPKALAVLSVALVAQFVSAGNPGCTRSYTVKAGDICDSISAANNVSTYQLAVINDNIIDPDCDNLMPGSTLCLGWQGQDCSTTRVVKLGDTCDGITYASGVNETIFYLNNPQLNEDCTNLYVGEVVCTSSIVQVPPKPASGTIPGSAIPPTSTPADGDLPYCDEI